MIASAPTIQVVATYAALIGGGVLAAVGLVAEYRRQWRDYRARKEATARRQRIRDRRITDRYTHDNTKRWA